MFCTLILTIKITNIQITIYNKNEPFYTKVWLEIAHQLLTIEPTELGFCDR